jgi:hypothetical protein
MKVMLEEIARKKAERLQAEAPAEGGACAAGDACAQDGAASPADGLPPGDLPARQ